MTDGVTALIFGAGFGAWIYTMMMRSTSNAKSSIVAAIVAAFGGFIVIFTLLKFVFHF
jgi:hypothetical protein